MNITKVYVSKRKSSVKGASKRVYEDEETNREWSYSYQEKKIDWLLTLLWILLRWDFLIWELIFLLRTFLYSSW